MQSDQTHPAIWCLLDSRPGHRNQVLGLADAIERQTKVDVQHVTVSGVTNGILSGFGRRTNLPLAKPALIIGAGHSTHMPLLQLGKRFKARTVVLMKPTFPAWCFDLCVVPDVYQWRNTSQHVFLTNGVLNRITPSQNADARRGLFLIGGPSDHHSWSDDLTTRQILEVMRKNSDTRWVVATSRRTPDSFVEMIQQQSTNPDIVTPDSVDSQWLPEQFGKSGTAWVTEDSVSMMYEAVTSGAKTGVIELPRTRTNRATQCVDRLLASKNVTSWTEWKRTNQLHESPERLSEADRCATEILNRGWFEQHSQAMNEIAA